jgi:hypothetical protein
MKASLICATFGDDEPRPRRNWKVSRLFLAALVGVALIGCNSLPGSKSGSGQTANPARLYVAAGVGNLQTYSIDHAASSFVVTSYGSGGSTIMASGSLSQLPNGILNLNMTYLPGQIISNPPLTGNWVVEMPGQAALMELETTSAFGTNTSFAPLAPTQSCPSLNPAESFQFVTIPKKLSTIPSLSANGWNPQLETAYGSVSIATSGATVQFTNISQHTFPATIGGAAGSPVNPASPTATSACSSTFYGQTISIPNSGTVLNPGSQQSVPPSATVGIGPTGFLVEDSGTPRGTFDPSIPPYENVLGAGYGAIGLIKPTTPLATSTLASAQYQGILYGAASGSSAAIGTAGFRLIGSFGYPNLQTSCTTLPAPTTSTIIYGGEFANNDPSPSANAFGNCDLAIDLGTQDSGNNGLYPAATVYVSAGFPNNDQGSAYSFNAVAVAGQINGKYGIFLIGLELDKTGVPIQPWGIYLLQSN